ncbi:MAG: PKD domain-containing protein [Bacteroidales bacterium]|nr:PKD domain-containing protein [Bacteroidales bacterium]MCF8454553.1 PKD domain-containing protein [Bacteroidales bacterium]
MKVNLFSITNAVLVLTLFFAVSCKKDDRNKNPTCEIASPAANQVFAKGIVIPIIVNATDDDGTIEEVQYQVDNVGVGSATSFPYEFNWNSGEGTLGSHTIIATSKDNNGGSASDEVTITLIEGSAPLAGFSATPQTGIIPINVKFTDESQNNPVSWLWDFGDGSASTEQNPVHTYSNAGKYTVVLTVVNSYGTDSETKTEFIEATTGIPVVNFSASDSIIIVGESVSFTDLSTDSPITWDWDFGDGNSSFEQNPTHVYDTVGIYTVMLTANNSYGSGTETKTNFITVESTDGHPCPEIPTFEYEGQTYNTVKIGDQCWMKENLNYETSSGSYCYDDDPVNCETYGRLYIWNAIMNGESGSNDVPSGVLGICPSGWHIPSDAEWDVIVNYLGGNNVAGGKMKEVGYEHWENPNEDADNSSGFTALPGGEKYGTFNGLGSYGRWWSSTQFSPTQAWYRTMSGIWGGVYQDYTNKLKGFSLRCLKD